MKSGLPSAGRAAKKGVICCGGRFDAEEEARWSCADCAVNESAVITGAEMRFMSVVQRRYFL